MGKRLQRQIAPRPQSQLSTSPATRHINELSKGKVIDLTAESSSEDSLITGTQLELVEAPVTTPQGLAPAVVTSKAPAVHPLTNPASTFTTGAQATPQVPPITLQPEISGTVPQAAAQDPAATGNTEVGDPTSQSTSDSNRSSNDEALWRSSSPFSQECNRIQPCRVFVTTTNHFVRTDDHYAFHPNCSQRIASAFSQN